MRTLIDIWLRVACVCTDENTKRDTALLMTLMDSKRGEVEELMMIDHFRHAWRHCSWWLITSVMRDGTAHDDFVQLVFQQQMTLSQSNELSFEPKTPLPYHFWSASWVVGKRRGRRWAVAACKSLQLSSITAINNQINRSIYDTLIRNQEKINLVHTESVGSTG